MRALSRLAPLFTAVLGAAFVAGMPSAAAGGGGCHEETAPRDSTGDTVILQQHCFGPTVLRVAPGSEVTFRNHDTAPHHISGVAMQWGTGGDLREGETERFLFADPGLYPYTCYYHPGMSGVIVVGDGVFTDARPEVSRSVSQAQERVQVSNRPSAGSGEPSNTGPQVASTLAPGDGEDNPLLFAAIGVLIGAVAVSLAVAAKGMRSR